MLVWTDVIGEGGCRREVRERGGEKGISRVKGRCVTEKRHEEEERMRERRKKGETERQN